MSAPARFTSDSSASDSRPTEPVSRQATVFSSIVAIAAAIDSHANRVSEGGLIGLRYRRRGARPRRG